MKTLIVEDDPTSRLLLQEVLKPYGTVRFTLNGREAVAAVDAARDVGEPYDLVCLDIMMPEMDGYEALERIRLSEEERGIPLSQGAKIVMTTALDQVKNASRAFRGLCDAYFPKPIDPGKLLQKLRAFHLI